MLDCMGDRNTAYIMPIELATAMLVYNGKKNQTQNIHILKEEFCKNYIKMYCTWIRFGF